MLEVTDLPPQIVPAVDAFANGLAAHLRNHRDTSLEVHEQGVLDAWRAEAGAVLTGVVTGADPWRGHYGVLVHAVAVVDLPSAGGAEALRRDWAGSRSPARGTGALPARAREMADRTLGLAPRQRTSVVLARWEAQLAALITFREAAVLLDELARGAVGGDTLRTYAKRLGTEREGQHRRAIGPVEATQAPPRELPHDPAPGVLVVEAEGVLVRCRDRSPWHEVKLGVVRGWTGSRPDAHLQAPTMWRRVRRQRYSRVALAPKLPAVGR